MSSEHDEDDDLRPEYNLAELRRAGPRGKYVDRYRAGSCSPAASGDDDDDVLAADDEPFHLTADMIAELEESIAQADRGETVPAEQVLAELRARTAQSKLSPPALPTDVIP